MTQNIGFGTPQSCSMCTSTQQFIKLVAPEMSLAPRQYDNVSYLYLGICAICNIPHATNCGASGTAIDVGRLVMFQKWSQDCTVCQYHTVSLTLTSSSCIQLPPLASSFPSPLLVYCPARNRTHNALYPPLLPSPFMVLKAYLRFNQVIHRNYSRVPCIFKIPFHNQLSQKAVNMTCMGLNKHIHSALAGLPTCLPLKH